jgi:patatin-like phospholipase/acyl hydrolase
MSFYRILSLDGGGIRGLLTAILLARLEEAQPGVVAQSDLIAGTSIGGIMALMLAAGFSAAEVVQGVEMSGTAVFSAPSTADVNKSGETAALYNNENLKSALDMIFGERTLADLPKKVLIATFDLDSRAQGGLGSFRTWKPKFFHNFPGPDSDGHEKVVDVALRTSAAPIYFPIYQGYVDGGVVAKNPAMCALAQAIDVNSGGQALSDIALLSLGTGQNAHFLALDEGDAGNWGLAQWSVDMRLLDVTWGNDVSLVNFQCGRFLGERYHRLDPVLSEAVHLDDFAQLRRLIAVARQEDLTGATAWLQRYF